VVYAGIVLLSYLWHFQPEILQWVTPCAPERATDPKAGTSKVPQRAAGLPEAPIIDAQDFRLCCNFSAQVRCWLRTCYPV